LRQIEIQIANGKTTPQASREAGITEQTYRWRKEYGGEGHHPSKSAGNYLFRVLTGKDAHPALPKRAI
jgi:hypothetical protein